MRCLPCCSGVLWSASSTRHLLMPLRPRIPKHPFFAERVGQGWQAPGAPDTCQPCPTRTSFYFFCRSASKAESDIGLKNRCQAVLAPNLEGYAGPAGPTPPSRFGAALIFTGLALKSSALVHRVLAGATMPKRSTFQRKAVSEPASGRSYCTKQNHKNLQFFRHQNALTVKFTV